MNPFVNPNQRSISLPNGCKDLADVLNHSESKHDGAVRQFIHYVLLQAQQAQATKLILVPVSEDAGVQMHYKLGGMWYDMAPCPWQIRTDLVSELARMAKLPEADFPCHGVLDEMCGDVRLLWSVNLTRADGGCLLVRLKDAHDIV